MLVKKFKIRFSAGALCLALCFAPIYVRADDGFGERFTQEAPSAFSDPAIDGAAFDQIEPAAGVESVAEDKDKDKDVDLGLENIISEPAPSTENIDDKAL